MQFVPHFCEILPFLEKDACLQNVAIFANPPFLYILNRQISKYSLQQVINFDSFFGYGSYFIIGYGPYLNFWIWSQS